MPEERKGKYGALIKQARQPDDQKAGKPNNQTTGKPDNQQSDQGVGQQARQPDSQITRQPETQASEQSDVRMVNLCVKVPEPLRRFWAAQSKLQGITMTEVIVDALAEKFGKPEDR